MADYEKTDKCNWKDKKTEIVCRYETAIFFKWKISEVLLKFGLWSSKWLKVEVEGKVTKVMDISEIRS